MGGSNQSKEDSGDNKENEGTAQNTQFGTDHS